MPILLVTVMLSGMGFGLVMPPFLFLAENLGASKTIATTIVGLFSIGQFIATPIWGRLSDRYGRKPILIISMAGLTVSYVLLAFAEYLATPLNLWILAGARLLNGLMSANLSVAMAYVSDVTPEEKRAQGMGFIGGAISIGFMVGPALGGLLGGSDAASASLTVPSLVAAGVSVVTVFAMLFLKESMTPEQRAKHHHADQPGGLQAAKQVMRRPILAQMMLIGFLVYFAMALFETVFPFWSGARFGWGPREVGLSFTYLGVLVFLVQGILVGRLVPRFGEGRLVLIGLALYVFGLIFMTQSPDWPVMMIGITFTAGGGAMFITTMSSLVSKQAAESERGLVLGVYQSASWFGRSGGPPVTGLLFEGFGPNSPLFCGALMILPCIGLLVGLRRRTTTAAAEPETN